MAPSALMFRSALQSLPVRNELECKGQDTVDDLRAPRYIDAALELLLEEDTGLLVIAVEDKPDNGLWAVAGQSCSC